MSQLYGDTSFQIYSNGFDKIYNNRIEMDTNPEYDGIGIGRFVLIQYTQKDLSSINGKEEFNENLVKDKNKYNDISKSDTGYHATVWQKGYDEINRYYYQKICSLDSKLYDFGQEQKQEWENITEQMTIAVQNAEDFNEKQAENLETLTTFLDKQLITTKPSFNEEDNGVQKLTITTKMSDAQEQNPKVITADLIYQFDDTLNVDVIENDIISIGVNGTKVGVGRSTGMAAEYFNDYYIDTKKLGDYSFTIGSSNNARGFGSFCGGELNFNSGTHSFVYGQYNNNDVGGDYSYIFGNDIYSDSPNNIILGHFINYKEDKTWSIQDNNIILGNYINYDDGKERQTKFHFINLGYHNFIDPKSLNNMVFGAYNALSYGGNSSTYEEIIGNNIILGKNNILQKIDKDLPDSAVLYEDPITSEEIPVKPYNYNCCLIGDSNLIEGGQPSESILTTPIYEALRIGDYYNQDNSFDTIKLDNQTPLNLDLQFDSYSYKLKSSTGLFSSGEDSISSFSGATIDSALNLKSSNNNTFTFNLQTSASSGFSSERNLTLTCQGKLCLYINIQYYPNLKFLTNCIENDSLNNFNIIKYIPIADTTENYLKEVISNVKITGYIETFHRAYDDKTFYMCILDFENSEWLEELNQTDCYFCLALDNTKVNIEELEEFNSSLNQFGENYGGFNVKIHTLSKTIEKLPFNTYLLGHNLLSTYSNQYIFGHYNENKENVLFAIGNGSDEDNRNNAFEIMQDGTINLNTDKININGTPLATYIANNS